MLLGLTSDALLLVGCYVYVLLVIFLSGKIEGIFDVSRKTSRKFLHVMIGNLPFVIPFFTFAFFPTLVAAPFVVVTILACSFRPFEGFGNRMKNLTNLTDEGHRFGLVFYAISYTCLAFLFGSKPYIIAAGILPMAYGDAAASVIGEKFGKNRYRTVAQKSLEGSAAMFLFSFASLALGMLFFSVFYDFAWTSKIAAMLAAAAAATAVEAFSPMGFDNLTVPAFSVLIFLLYGGF